MRGLTLFTFLLAGAITLLLALTTATGCDRDEKPASGSAKTSDDAAKPRATPRKRAPAPAAAEHVADRRRMVERQMMRPGDGRDPIRSPAVLEVMRSVPRHAFVPERLRRHAHGDTPLPIGHGQTISQPYIVAWMTELLDLDADDRVLEIGTGSGYQAAVLAHLTPHVFSVEVVDPLAKKARTTLEKQGYTEVETRIGDGYHGWKEKGPFDAIIVTCAAGHLPPPLWEQLKPGGRIIIPIGGPLEVQRLVLVTRTADGERRTRTLGAVRFVPLTRGSK